MRHFFVILSPSMSTIFGGYVGYLASKYNWWILLLIVPYIFQLLFRNYVEKNKL